MTGRAARALNDPRCLSLVTAAAMAVCYNLQPFPLHLVFLVPVLVAMRNAGSVRAASRSALLSMFAGCYLLTYWLLFLIRYSWLAPATYLLSPPYYAVWMSAPLIAAEAARRRTGWPMVLILPPLMVLQEHLIGLGELGFPVGVWSHYLSLWPRLLQMSEWTGPLGICAWLATVNSLVYDACCAVRYGNAPSARRSAAIWAVAALVLAFAVPIAGARRMREVAGQTQQHRTLRTVALQPNIDLFVKHDLKKRSETLSSILSLAREGAREADLVATPESSLPGMVRHFVKEEAEPDLGGFAALAAEQRVHFLAGALYARIRGKDDYDLFNAALLIGPDGRLEDWNAKARLLPFIEGLPYLHRLGINRIKIPGGEFFKQIGGFTPGEAGRPLKMDGGHRLGVLFCSEEFYPRLSRALVANGADLLACISEDTWYASSPRFARLLSRLSVPRCIETRRACVRSANTGISGFITPDGAFHDETELWTRAAIRRDLPVSTETTFYVRYGNWLALVACLWLLPVVAGVMMLGKKAVAC